MASVIEFKKVVKKFNVGGSFFKQKTKEVLKGINLTINDGEIVALVGASGSGKSTIANLILKIFDYEGGDILFHNKSIKILNKKEIKEYHRKVQIIFQDPYSSLDPTHTVYWHIERPLRLRHVSDIDSNVYKILSAVSLVPPENYVNLYPHELSGGLRQRVYIGRTLATNPDLLIADEPVSMLDASIRADILELLKDINKNRHATILYITHDLSTVNYIADRVYVINDGIIVESGKTSDIIKNPQNEYTKKLIEATPDPYKRI